MLRSKRFEKLAERDVNKEVFIDELHDLDLTIMDSPNDPTPSIEIKIGEIIELDGRSKAEFDVIDQFIAQYAIDVAQAKFSMQMSAVEIARMMVDFNVSQKEVTQVLSGCSPAKLLEVAKQLNVIEMMMAMQKMRQRKKPANQAHVTNWEENPALLAAEAGLRGFVEEETTVRVTRMAPFSALALLVGSQVGRPAS